jgi:hypothetical protein
VAVSGDTAVIGATDDDDLGTNSGAAYVFMRSGTSWTQQAKLLADDGGSGDDFSYSVAVSGDTAVIGTPGDNDLGSESGAAYVFVRSGTSWTQQAKLLADDGMQNDWLGVSVAVSGDTAVISANGVDDLGTGAGAAYVFVRSGTSWTQQAKLLADDGASFDTFGYSVAVSGDTAVIGAYGRDDLGDRSGAAYVFVRSGTSWTQQAKLLADDGAASDYFGWKVAVSGDTAVIGADWDDDLGTNSGGAYVFVRSGTSWTQQTKLLADDGASFDRFGYSVAVSGNRAVIGAPEDDDLGDRSGSAYVLSVENNLYADLEALADVNGNNNTDFGVLLRDADPDRNKLYVMDGGDGNEITTVGYGIEPARGSSTVPDATGDQVPEFSVLVEGSLFARVRDVVNNTLLGRPSFNANYDPVAFFSVGDAGGSAGPDVVMVGRLESTGRVLAWVREAQGGAPVSQMTFSKAFVPFDAVAVDNVGDSAAMEIAVLGINASGKVQATVKDAASGNLVGKVVFSKAFAPLFFAAVPDANGDLTHLAVLGRKATGIIQAQIKRVSDGALVANVRFSKNYDPMAFISFADSNGSGGGEVGVVGVNATGTVRSEVKEIADGATVSTIKYNRDFPAVGAIAVNGAAGTSRNEIAVLGEDINGNHLLLIKDLLTGELVRNIPVP